MHIPEAQSFPVPQEFPDLPEPIDIITFMAAREGWEPVMGGGPGIGCAPDMAAGGAAVGGMAAGGMGAVF